MEELGWLRRARDTDDRRAWRIVLTATGRQLHNRVAPLYVNALRQTLHNFDAGEIEPLTHALGEIRRAAHAAVDAVLAAPPQARRPRRTQP